MATVEQRADSTVQAYLRPRLPLSHQEFSERYIKLPPTGPYGGLRFRVDRQPFMGLLFRELDRGYWNECYITGTVQSGKTLGAFVIPTLRDVIELRLGPVIAVPEATMASDKWDTDFMPVLESSDDLRHLIPSKGPGSKGGRIRERVTLNNGIHIKVMSRGGQATNKAGFTTPRLHMTEAAGFSEGSETSEEADEFRQILRRLDAFSMTDPRRCATIEGTVTIADHLPWRARGADDDEVLLSSRSKLVAPCPHCEAWISPEREHLVGWKDAESQQQAIDQACFVCPECSQAINDDQRRASVRDCRIVHWGQEVTPDGEVIGDLPPVRTLWFRWTAYFNLLLKAADTAVKEWAADQIEEGTLDRENAERDLCQKSHAIPFQSSLAENEPLKPEVVRKRFCRVPEWQRGVLPPDTVTVDVGLDIGDWTSWWFAIAGRANGELHCPAYGAFDVKRNKTDDLATRLIQALQEFNEEVIQAGFPVEGKDGMWIPDLVGVDIGYLPDEVATAVRSFGGGLLNRWKGMRGRGASIKRSGSYTHPKKVTKLIRRVGNQWYSEWNHKRRIEEITFNSDYWTLMLQEHLRVKVGEQGALSFFRADTPNEHAKVSQHLTADQLRREFDPEKGGEVEKWIKRGKNHWGDAGKMALIMLDRRGYRVRDCPIDLTSFRAPQQPTALAIHSQLSSMPDGRAFFET